jgi:hypothetical protein
MRLMQYVFLLCKLLLVAACVLLMDHAAYLALPKVMYSCLPIWCWLLPTDRRPIVT